MKHPVIIGLFSLFFCISCSQSNYKSSLDNTQIPANSMLEEGSPGQGWNSEKESLAGSCLEGSIVHSGSTQASIIYNNYTTKEDLFSAVGFSFSAKSKFGIYSGNAAAQFAAANSEDSYSSVTIYSAQYDFKNEVFKPSGNLSQVGNLIFKANEKNKSAWLEACGNEYIAQTKKGAQLLYSARIDFISEEDKSSFNGQIGLSGPLTELSASIVKAAEKFKSKATITISAFQRGGDVSQLSKAFNYQSSNKDIALIRCSMASLEPCLKTLEALILYATDEHGFPAQIKNNGENGAGSNTLYISMPYKTAGIFAEGDLLLRRLIRQQRRDIEAKLERNILINNRLKFFEKLESESGQVLSEVKERLKKAYAANQILISDAITNCYDDLYSIDQTVKEMRDSCNQSVNLLNQNFIDLPEKLIEQLKEQTISCDNGYVNTENGCQAVSCKNGKIFGELWNIELENNAGTAKYTCNEDAVESITAVACNLNSHFQPVDSYGNSRLICEPKPCYIADIMRQHGTNWEIQIENGKRIMSCQFGVVKSVAGFCKADYTYKDSSCIGEVKYKSCDAPDGSKVMLGSSYISHHCNYAVIKNTPHLLIETTFLCKQLKQNEFKLEKLSSQTIGRCGKGWEVLL